MVGRVTGNTHIFLGGGALERMLLVFDVRVLVVKFEGEGRRTLYGCTNGCYEKGDIPKILPCRPQFYRADLGNDERIHSLMQYKV